MPAETHQKGRRADPAIVAEFLAAVLGVDFQEAGVTEGVTLQECGVTVEDIDWLWEAACEDLGERSLAPDFDIDVLRPSMSLLEAAEVMAATFSPGREEDI